MATLFACHQPAADAGVLQQHIDSLERKLTDACKPVLEEFMSSIQVHHSRLRFAGKYQNWRLACFELHEMMATMDGVRQFETGRNGRPLYRDYRPCHG